MIEDLYQDIQRSLGVYPSLSISFDQETETIFLQNDYETVGIRDRPNGRYNLSYLLISADRGLAEATLRDCPPIIRDWHNRLKGLQDLVMKRGKEYVQVPAFSTDIDAKDLMELCLFLGAKLASNERENVTVN